MMKKSVIHYAVIAAFLAASGVSGLALAVDESESNNWIQTPNQLTVGSDGSVSVNAVMGALEGSAILDLDFFSFEAKEGDVMTVDIENGMKSAGTGRSVDTMLFLFDSSYKIKRSNNNASTTDRNARIDLFRAEVSGTYIVGVSSAPRLLQDGGTPSPATGNMLNSLSNGAYTLAISGVTPAIQQVNIDIKPGNDKPAPLNPKSKGVIPVALLSSAEFNALAVDQQSLGFGATGNEKNLGRCNKEGKDVNGDGRPDLLCHFDNELSGFAADDLEGIVKGKTANGRMFEGRGWLKVVPKSE